MKHYISLAIAAAIIGFAWFAVEYWIFNVNYKEALRIGRNFAIIGFFIECIRPYIKSRYIKK